MSKIEDQFTKIDESNKDLQQKIALGDFFGFIERTLNEDKQQFKEELKVKAASLMHDINDKFSILIDQVSSLQEDNANLHERLASIEQALNLQPPSTVDDVKKGESRSRETRAMARERRSQDQTLL